MATVLMSIIFGFIGVIFILILIFTYNTIVSYKQSADSASNSVKVELKKRSELIPEIINTVKGFVKHEDELLSKLTQIREGTSDEFTKTLLGVAEAYPVLRSSDAFIQLQSTLEKVENNIAAARHIYNSNVDYYNSEINSFPGFLLGFIEMQYYKLEKFNEEVVHVPTNFK